MAALKKHINTKLNGATLIESIVAMVLVLLCFVIASMVFVKVNNSAFLVHQYKAKELVNSWDSESILIEETEINLNDWALKRAFRLYKDPDIWELYYQAWEPNGSLIYEEKRLKYIKKQADEISVER